MPRVRVPHLHPVREVLLPPLRDLFRRGLVAEELVGGTPVSSGRRSPRARCTKHAAGPLQPPAAWMSAAGSNRVKVVQRKFMGLRAAFSASSTTTINGQSAKSRRLATRSAHSGFCSKVGPETTRHPRQNTRRSRTSAGGFPPNSPGSERTGSPTPRITPFEPLVHLGPGVVQGIHGQVPEHVEIGAEVGALQDVFPGPRGSP